MSKLPAPDSRAPWLQASIIPQEVLILGASHWYSHWDPRIRRARRCASIDCAICASGTPAQIRYVLYVRSLGDEYLLELRTRHWQLLSEIQDIYGSLIGCTLRVWRDSSAPNAPVSCCFVSFSDCVEERSISALVSRFGAEPVFTRDSAHSALTGPDRASARLRAVGE